MALSKPSVATVIQDNENWFRLATFLHEPLKNALLSVLHNLTNDPTYQGLPQNPFLLYQEFSKQHSLIKKLVKKRILQQDQVDLLLPPNSNQTDSSKFDVTLIAVLIRNFTTLQAPINGWNDKNPPAHDRSKGAGVIRGREWRNYVHHTDPKDVDQATLNQKWIEGSQIINDLGYIYNINLLKTISLDPKHDIVLKALLSYIKNLETKVNSNEAKQSKLVSDLDTKVDANEAKQSKIVSDLDAKVDANITNLSSKFESNTKLIVNLKQQVNRISDEAQYIQKQKQKENYTKTKSSSCCLKSVLEYISKEIKGEEADELVASLHLQHDGNLMEELKFVPWENIKRELKMLGRVDLVEHIRKNTLITKGLKNASDELRNQYQSELINCLVELPLSSVEMDLQYASREEIYIDLVVLPSSTVDKEWTNSDRKALMEQNLLKKTSTVKAIDSVIDHQDEMVFIRGVAGVGKSTLIDMFTLKWTKNELSNHSMFDFVFKFTCRELNQILDEFIRVEQLLTKLYPEVFRDVTLEELNEISERVLIIVDGVDELKDIYEIDGIKASSKDSSLKVISDLLNPKSMKGLKNHKTIVCGRLKACEFVKNQISKSKKKTVEVCGFSPTNVQKYIVKFFDKHQTKAKQI